MAEQNQASAIFKTFQNAAIESELNCLEQDITNYDEPTAGFMYRKCLTVFYPIMLDMF
jgi:hypothetical protein